LSKAAAPLATATHEGPPCRHVAHGPVEQSLRMLIFGRHVQETQVYQFIEGICLKLSRKAASRAFLVHRRTLAKKQKTLLGEVL
jgi:hypothetical protein